MSDPKTQQEPSMEEILASIRRIISEDADQKPGAAAPAPAAKGAEPAHSPPGDDVLTLTDRVDEGDFGGAREPEPLFNFDPDPEPEPEPEHHGHHDEPEFGDSLMSRTAASSAADAFSQLRDMTEPEPSRPNSGVVIEGAANNVLEAIIREAVKPILKDWLDRNLPGIVEDLVRAEIQRVAQGPGARRR